MTIHRCSSVHYTGIRSATIRIIGDLRLSGAKGRARGQREILSSPPERPIPITSRCFAEQLQRFGDFVLTSSSSRLGLISQRGIRMPLRAQVLVLESAPRASVPSPDVVTQLEQNSALGEVLASGFRALNSDPRCSEADLRASMENAGRAVAHRLERYLPALATIASAAPLLGLLGTVIGMIEIFGSQTPTGGAPGGNPAQLAHGISVALYNTAFGLIVAIPSLIFWRYFRARVDGFLLTLELSAERFVRHLNNLRKS